MPPEIVELIGAIAITIMVTCYALEHRNPVYTLLFAFGCLLAAGYAVLIGSYPFVVAEFVWGVIAFDRWRKARS